jgi:hypothetical protein
VPGPHRSRVSNTSSRANRECCIVRQGRSPHGWAALGPRQVAGRSVTTPSSIDPPADFSRRGKRNWTLDGLYSRARSGPPGAGIGGKGARSGGVRGPAGPAA